MVESLKAIMPIYFNSLLGQFGISPATVVLLRHKDKSAARGRTPYELWRDSPGGFETYQMCQSFENRSRLSRASFWASFVGTPDGGTMFVGIYAATHTGPLAVDIPKPHREGVDLAGSCDQYDLRLDQRFIDLQGKLFVDWGDGTRSWIQRADKQNKALSELRPEFKEPQFPGLLNFIEPLSKIEALPATWISVLKEAAGVYLLTCPRTKEQYVGKASGAEGFWSRWRQYVTNDHGGNIALKSREYSDYHVSVLEVAGSAATAEDVLAMESRWKKKLKSQEVGLNRN
jgi:hypothetical protein